MRLVILAALTVLFLAAPPAGAHCRNNHCLWHGSRHAHAHIPRRYVRHAHSGRRQAGREESALRGPARGICQAPLAPPARSSEAWDSAPDPTGWPGRWVRARGLSPSSQWQL